MLIECDVCKSRDLVKIRNLADKIIYKCLYCGIVSFYPKPTVSKINSKNDQRYNYNNNAEEAYLKKETDLRQRARTCIETISKFKKSGNLIDIGCSYGFYLDEFRTVGFNVYGIDPTSKSIEYAKKKLNLKVEKTTLEEYRSKIKYDYVLMVDVIEHFPNPLIQLNKVKKIINPGGILYVQTPNFNSFISSLTKNKWFWLLIPEHLHLYTKESLKNQAKNMGFEVLKMYTWDDKDEFIKNVLSIIYLKDKGKTKLIYFLFYYLLMLLYPIFHIPIKYFDAGGEISMYFRTN